MLRCLTNARGRVGGVQCRDLLRGTCFCHFLTQKSSASVLDICCSLVYTLALADLLIAEPPDTCRGLMKLTHLFLTGGCTLRSAVVALFHSFFDASLLLSEARSCAHDVKYHLDPHVSPTSPQPRDTDTSSYMSTTDISLQLSFG